MAAAAPVPGGVRLVDLLAATGGRDGGNGACCPRCRAVLRVDADEDRWSCPAGCGAGGPVELVALARGVSVSHATALLRAGWRPTPTSPLSAGSSSVRALPALCAPDADDQTLLAAVFDHYAQALAGSPTGRAWLDRLGVDDDLASELRLGVADRTLGYRLPEANRKTGAALRGRLTGLGIYRASGHEHLTGCLVIPILDPDGSVVGLCGYRLDRVDAEPLWADGLPGGLFGEPTGPAAGEPLLLVGSVRDALAVLATGRRGVVAPGRPGGYQRADIPRLADLDARVTVVVDDPRLVDRLQAAGITCTAVTVGAPLADLLANARDPQHALDALLASADQPTSRQNPGRRDEAVIAADAAANAADDEPAVSGEAAELHVRFAERGWRVRGADRNRAPDVLRVALSVTDTKSGAFHLDTLDLYAAKARAAFLAAASAELSLGTAVLRGELAQVLFAVEAALAGRDNPPPAAAMSETEREAALALLRDPHLLSRVADDLAALGVVGERTNLLVAYLATISRNCERPFGVVIQSSSAAGKSTLADAVCSLVPEEDLAAYSALTGQALYYLGGQSLAHKVLAVAEEQGASRASYALKLLVTEGRLAIASTGKDPATGRLRTTSYEVSGPVALVLTTTAAEIDPELANRLIVLGVDEEVAQTRAIHAAQRHAATLDGLLARVRRDEILSLHWNAQRLLDPLPVVIPDVEGLSFPVHAVRHRRDHQKLLALISASALLHQHQRTRRTVDVGGRQVDYLEAEQADIDLALRLADVVLARGGDGLAPHTQRLLREAERLVAEKTTADVDAGDRPRSPVWFTRRELRARLGGNEYSVRAGLARLIALEYIAVVPGPVGCPHRYVLIDAPITFPSPGEPVGTQRPPGAFDPPGALAARTAQTPDPVTRRRDAGHGEAPMRVVGVGADPVTGHAP